MSLTDRIVQRVLEVRKRRRFSQSEMGARLGLTEEAYRALEKGRTIRLEWDSINRLLVLLRESGLSPEWFFETGAAAERASREEEPAVPPAGSPQDRLHRALERAAAAVTAEAARSGRAAARRAPREEPDSRGVDELPIMDAATFGKAYHRKAGTVVGQRLRRLRIEQSAPAGAVGLVVRGELLAPTYNDGDILVCVPGAAAAGRAGLLVLTARKVVLGVWQEEGARLRFVPLDIDQPVRSPAPAEIVATYVVERHIRDAVK